METDISLEAAATLIQGAIGEQRAYLDLWRRPSEAILFEVLRAIDRVNCEELFVSNASTDAGANLQHLLAGWGVNHALSRTMPQRLAEGLFRLFRSEQSTQAKADEFLTQCGTLAVAELVEGVIADGMVRAALHVPGREGRSGIRQVLVLRSENHSLLYDNVARQHRKWFSDVTMTHDERWEAELSERYRAISPDLERSVGRFQDWGISYSTNDRIDDFFSECAQVYLRRMWSQDLVGPDERFGGHQFRDFLGVLVGVAGRAQKHLCFASLLARRHPELDLRNLLTTFAPCEEFVQGLARQLGAETMKVESLLESLTLSPENCALHTESSDVAWAPIVRASQRNYILPLYGLEINPFLFLLKDLQAKYPGDWDVAANNRERRWLQELKAIFPRPRWTVAERCPKLRDEGRVTTDLDFVAFDETRNEAALFQLKWQVPVGVDSRARRSAGRNFVSEGNKWIQAVQAWLSKYGIAELGKRAGVPMRSDTKVNLFVIGRYRSSFSGFDGHRREATWADWNHLVRVRSEEPEGSIAALTVALRARKSDNGALAKDSMVIPLRDLAIVLNPRATAEPA